MWQAVPGETGGIGQGVGTFREGPHGNPGLSALPRAALLKGLDLYFLLGRDRRNLYVS